MATPPVNSPVREGEHEAAYTPKTPLIGFMYEAVGLIIVWFLFAFINSARQACLLDATPCITWRALLLTLAVVLTGLNLAAIQHFRKLRPNPQPVRVKQTVGIGFGILGTAAGLVVAISTVGGLFF